ncbi:A-alpha X1 [Schizophyllum fasciatum]
MAHGITLDKLSRDVLAAIMEIVYASSPHSITAILSCNSTLYKVARPFMIRDCTLRLDLEQLPKTHRRIAAWLEDPSLSWVLPAMRSVTLRADAPVSVGPKRNFTKEELLKETAWDPFIALLSKLTNLVDVTFDCPVPIPPRLLRALEQYHPDVHLHILNWARLAPSTLADDPSEVALAESPLLRTIHANVLLDMRGHDFQLVAFERILARSPNLHSFRYKSRIPGGCCVWALDEEQMQERDRLCELFRAEPIRKPLKHVDINNMPPSMVARLAHFIDWSSVETLRGLLIGDELETLPWDASLFTSLEFIELRLDRVNRGSDLEQRQRTLHSLTDFLIVLPHIESFSIANLHEYQLLDTLLQHRGPQLRTLHVHEVELPSETYFIARRTFTSKEIVAIRTACPHLDDFALDLKGWPENEPDILHALAQFPAMRRLTLNVPLLHLPLDDIEDQDASETYEQAKMAWQAVAGEKMGRSLEELVVCFGEQAREIGRGRPASWVIEERRLRRCLTLRPHERDDRPGGKFVINHK